MEDELLLCAPPAIAGLLLGLWLGPRFSRWAVAALATCILIFFALLIAFGETWQWLFVASVVAAAALGGFTGPAVESRWLGSTIISGLVAPTVTFAVVSIGFMIACGVWGGCL